jgi:hypothetical protein
LLIDGDRAGPIAATVSDDDDLVGDPGLGGKRFEGLSDQRFFVMRRNDDDDPARARVARVGDVPRPGEACRGEIALVLDEGGASASFSRL